MSCTFYKFKSSLFGGDYWCDKKDCEVDSDTYRKYCRDYNYSDCPIYKQTESSPCFITTLTCQILNLNDNDPVLTNLRDFRDNILQKDKKYAELLMIYDLIGPMIADSLYNDDSKEEMASDLYNYSLLPISKLINNKNYTQAVALYQSMTAFLITHYGLREEYYKLKLDNDNYFHELIPQMAGHGKRRVKTIHIYESK